MKQITLLTSLSLSLLAVWDAKTQTPLPANVDPAKNTPVVWLTPDNYNNGVWINRITSPGTAGNFTQPWTGPDVIKKPPVTTISQFHPAILFGGLNRDNAPYRLMSDSMIGISSTDAFTIILVHKRTNRTSWDQHNILNYGNDGDYAAPYNVRYPAPNMTDDNLTTGWTDASRHLGIVPFNTLQLVTIDNNNGGATNSESKGIVWYLGGERKGQTNTTVGGSANTAGSGPNGIHNYKIVIGGCHYENLITTGGASFIGFVQEVIILKRPRMSAPFLDETDRNKIHSYLAVKYGIPLKNCDYIASDGTTLVWDQTRNSGYNHHIFGIARDDAYGLYQKQGESADKPLFTAFVGDNVANLNRSNISGQLENNVYVLFGSNGVDLNAYTEITDPADQYAVVGSSQKLNYRRDLIYKAQITSSASLRVKFKPSDSSFMDEYMLISTDPTFPVNATDARLFRGSVVEKEFEPGVSYYISFAGRATLSGQGPGGVGSNLKLWLRADDNMNITTERLMSGSGKLEGYPDAPAKTWLPAVSEWKDALRSHIYSYAAGGNSDRHKKPVYQPVNYMMNFHPAVRFWGNGSVYSAYLGNSNGVWSTSFPTNNKHSAFFVVNNDFGTNAWIYTMMFGSANTASYNGPGYGVEKRNGDIVGRFRTNFDIYNGISGTKSLFTPGATSILGYHHEALGTTSGDRFIIRWRFNGLEDRQDNRYPYTVNAAFGLNQASTLGTGYDHDRVIQGVMSEVIMYDGELSQDSLRLIESYLALKYGITLTPDDQAQKKFDYMFSNGEMLWNGTAGLHTIWDTYYHRLAAIIRDDNAKLYNRQSHSTNVGSILHIGIAGSRMGSQVDLGYFDYDQEAVMWGDDNGSGTNPVSGVCGDFEEIFLRKWLVHKKTHNGRPIRLLVGAEDNSGNRLGQRSHGATAEDSVLFSKLAAGNDVYLIVADDPAKLTPGSPHFGQFKAVIPLCYIDGEHQCAYTFTDDTVYVTFGYTENSGNIGSEAVFGGVKVFNWTQWTRQDYGTNVSHLTRGAVDLGDSVRVIGSTIQYQNGVSAPTYYPSVTNTPVSNSLSLQRQGGGLNSTVTVTIDFNTPVRPEFSIYDIDGYSGHLEWVSVSGNRGSADMDPDLSYAGAPADACYEINGNVAVATETEKFPPANRNGQLDVSFRKGVTRVVIEYGITNRAPLVSTAGNLIISPIRLRPAPPPPLINENGLSFVKGVGKREITLCEPVEYSFHIENVNCEPKYVHFRDTLPVKMKWRKGIGMDEFNALKNTHIRFNSYDGSNILQIDSLFVPGGSTLKLTAVALLDEDAVPQGATEVFNNHAWIEYEQIVNNVSLARIQRSSDRETLADETFFRAEWRKRQQAVQSTISTAENFYRVEGEINVTIALNNPNPSPVTEAGLHVLFNEEFSYVSGSLATSSNITDAVVTTASINGEQPLLVAGDTDGASGFTIPTGVSTLTFTLRAPDFANLAYQLDQNNQPTSQVAELGLYYQVISETNDPCVTQSLADVSGTWRLPYKLLFAGNDHATTLSGATVEIPVFINDFYEAGCTPVFTLTGSPAHGNAVFVNDTLHYTPHPNTLGPDTATYRLDCNGDTVSAKVSLLVNSIPDNLNAVNCYVTPPSTPLDIERKAVSDTAVYELATPFVGDLDGDGRLEVVAPGLRKTGSPEVYATHYLVFNDSLKQIRSIGMEDDQDSIPAYYAMSFLIADTDNDGYGEIVYCTHRRRVHCYSYRDNAERWATPVGSYETKIPWPDHESPSLIVADIDGDGFSEILAVNKIFAGESGVELVELPAGGRGSAEGGPDAYMPVFADVDNDGIQEVVAGNTVYEVKITNRLGSNGNTATVLAQAPHSLPDGFTSVADMDLDGDLDVIVTGAAGAVSAHKAVMYVWDGATPTLIGDTVQIDSKDSRISRVCAGDFVEVGRPDIAFTHGGTIADKGALEAYRYDSVANKLVRLWSKETSDKSGVTTLTLFDFDQDGISELVYRDETDFRIVDRNGNNRSSFPCRSETHTECPVIVDLDRDGQADILVSGDTSSVYNSNSVKYNVRIVRYGSRTGGWAAARRVWNQHAYNSLHINEDLSVPRFPPNPATVFPGADGRWGTSDDVRPYNAFLQQQTARNSKGLSHWPAPDLRPVAEGSELCVSDDTVTVTIAVCNQGDAIFRSPVYATFYNRNGIAVANSVAVDSLTENIPVGDTAYITATYITSDPILYVIVRVNDHNENFPLSGPDTECEESNNEWVIFNNMYHLYMKKHASIDGVPDNGLYENPVSVLGNDIIQYRITAVNMSQNTGSVIIRDTLPPYLRYRSGTAIPGTAAVFLHDSTAVRPGIPRLDVLTWTLNHVASAKDTAVSFEASPEPGACASQPMFVNRAWITVNNRTVETDSSVYHQGAGVALLTFAAGYGGTICNAQPQALDYRAFPRSGILVVPDDGYAFTGWSHETYRSLRGEPVQARSGIMYYDTLPILGDVELTACFEPIRYPIRYFLHGGENAENNPHEYTVQSGVITLEAPRKADDVFIGWTGSNGIVPQQKLAIPGGSTGERTYYANYLHTGREGEVHPVIEELSDDLWGAQGELYVQTSKTGSVVRIYSLNGVLRGVHTILSSGVTKIKLQHGIYLVTLNNHVAQKIRIVN